MRWKTSKKASDLKLNGIHVESHVVDDSVKSVVLTDSAGNSIRFEYADYAMRVSIPAPPATEDKYQLTGAVAGVPVCHNFESEYEATVAKQEYQAKVRNSSDADLKIEKVKVVIPD